MRFLGFPELVVIVLAIAPFILYLLTLQRALRRCAPERRAIAPGQVWLLLIPLFNLAWHFVVVLRVARTLGAELEARGMAGGKAGTGKTIGLAMCTLQALVMAPVAGLAALAAGLVCWLVYWAKIAGCSRALAGESAGLN